MMSKLVAMYENGDITGDHLAVECLHLLDPANPAMVLAALPGGVLQRVLEYAREYRPGQMRTNYGPQPVVDQVAAAKKWIESRNRQSA
jgi:hypothetical protein